MLQIVLDYLPKCMQNLAYIISSSLEHLLTSLPLYIHVYIHTQMHTHTHIHTFQLGLR